MNTQDETAGKSATGRNWGGFEQLQLTDDARAVTVTIGSPDRWDKAHLRRLRQSADLPGLVPVIDSDFASDGKPFAVTPVVSTNTLADRVPPTGSEWESCAAITEAAARASHEAHLRGLFHGALSPDQIYVIDDDVAISGVGLGLGGTPSDDYAHWVAPEVKEGNDATERSDVYSLGKILEASLGSSIEDVPRSVRRLIMWSSSDTPEARPPSALEFASILAEAMGDDRQTFNPAFIPTAETNDLASTASESVAAFVPTESPSGGISAAETTTDQDADDSSDENGDTDDAEGSGLGGAAIAGAAGAAGAAAVAASVFSDEDGDDETLTDDVTTGELTSEASSDVSIEDAASATTDLDPADALEPDEEPVFDSRQYGQDIKEPVLDDAEYEVPAAAQTVDLDLAVEPDRKSNRAGIVVGAILALGLGAVAWGVLRSGDDTETVTPGDATSEEVAGDTTDDADATADADGTEDADATADADGTEDADATADADGTEDAEADATEDADGTEDADATEEDADGTEDAEADATEDADGTEDADATADADGTEDAEADATEDADGTEDADATEEDAGEAAPAATVDGPIAAADAGVQVLHGIPGVTVDVYVNGQALAPGFTPGTIAGPAKLDPGAYDIDIYAASDAAPAAAADRSDDAVISQTVTVGAKPATLVAHLDADGAPVLSAFEEDLSVLAQPASGRLQLRHLAAAPTVRALVDGESIGQLSPGLEAATTLSAGEHTIEATLADGTPVKSATINLADGEVASISIIGSAADETLAIAVQRYTGLATAPAGVPTGNSNLLAEGEDPTMLYILGILTSFMALAGGVVMIRRSREIL